MDRASTHGPQESNSGRLRNQPNANAREVGTLLQRLVNRVSHQNGETLAIMGEASLTLHQVLLLTRLRDAKQCTLSDLAGWLNLSLPAISQAVDRLKELDLVTRAENPADRRYKILSTTPKSDRLLDRLIDARAKEYSAGIADLSPALLEELKFVLRKVVKETSAASASARGGSRH
jgi:DNA-binding MarR family transcriptional regulator